MLAHSVHLQRGPLRSFRNILPRVEELGVDRWRTHGIDVHRIGPGIVPVRRESKGWKRTPGRESLTVGPESVESVRLAVAGRRAPGSFRGGAVSGGIQVAVHIGDG